METNIKNKLFILFLFIYIYNYKRNPKKIDKRFYNYKSVYPELEILKKNKNKIKEEYIKNTSYELWKKWPERYLYDGEDNWNIIPIYGFGIWNKLILDRIPVLYNILKKIKGLRTAIISKLKKNTQLKPHQGWANLSNYVLRCHYGIICNEESYIYVENESMKIREDDIVVFDDSKFHWAENNGLTDRVVLLLDIERPSCIEKGKSEVQDSEELNNFINAIKKQNYIKMDQDSYYHQSALIDD